MAYSNPGWVNNSAPAIDAENLNSISNTLTLVPVQNGGTGAGSFTSGALLKGSGTNAISTLSGTGAVYATSNNNPQFGTLPVSCGGTGTTNLNTLKSNMGLGKAGFVAQSSAPSNTSLR